MAASDPVDLEPDPVRIGFFGPMPPAILVG